MSHSRAAVSAGSPTIVDTPLLGYRQGCATTQPPAVLCICDASSASVFEATAGRQALGKQVTPRRLGRGVFAKQDRDEVDQSHMEDRTPRSMCMTKAAIAAPREGTGKRSAHLSCSDIVFGLLLLALI